jgi:hypothetical protein
MTTQADLYVAEALLGREAQEFVNTELGQFLVGRANLEKKDALEQLGRVSPWRRNRIRDLQARVWRAESFLVWIAELITLGTQAEQALQTELES